MITRDPETGVQNMGTYRAALKAPDRLVVRMATRVGGAGGYQHYLKHQSRGDKTMPCAIVLGCPPYVAFMGPQKLPLGVDEFDVAGGLAGAPINVVKAKTVDLLVPAESEIVIEGLIDTEYVEPEAPFGESHGHVALEEYNMPMRVTAITHRRKPVIPSYISQVAPSESSVIKRVAYEPLFLAHLREHARHPRRQARRAARAADRAAARHDHHDRERHAADRDLARAERRRVLQGRLRQDLHRGQRRHRSRQRGRAAVGDGVPHEPGRGRAARCRIAARATAPSASSDDDEDSTLLMDATMKGDMPPLALPKQEYMERAKAIWERLGLPALRPQPPWYGYSLGDWLPQWDEAAQRAATGGYLENGRVSEGQRRKGLKPETKFRPGEDD